MSVSNMSVRPYSDSGAVSRLSDVDEIAKFTVKDYKTEPMSILIISTQVFCERLKNVMTKIVEKKYAGKVVIKLAEDVDQVLNCGLDGTSVDYVAIVSDTTSRNCVNKVVNDIKKLGSLAATKLCLVNGSPKRGLGGTALEIVKVAETRSLLYINGEIMNNSSCQRVGERILAVAASSAGFHTGIPFILPTPVEVFNQLSYDI